MPLTSIQPRTVRNKTSRVVAVHRRGQEADMPC